MKPPLDPRPGAYRRGRGKMVLPTSAMVAEYKVHEPMLNSVLGAWACKELIDGPQEFTIEGVLEAVMAATAVSMDRQSNYLGHGILPHTLVVDRVVDPIFDSIGFLQADPDVQADVALVLEVMTLRFYTFLTEFLDMVGFTEYQCETIHFSHWQGRDMVMDFHDY
jgi:hypothetical protein